MNDKMVVQIIYSFVLYQMVMSYPIKDKYSLSDQVDYRNTRNAAESLSTRKDLPLEVSKLSMLPVERFLRRNISDIFNSSEQHASKMPEGKLRVSKVRYKERPPVNSKVSSQTEQPLPVNLQISLALEATRRTVTGRGQTGTELDVRRGNIQPPSTHQRDTDFLKSQSNPVVNHGSLPPNLNVHGELKVRPEKHHSVLVYEVKAGKNTNGVAKAAALATNLQEASPRRTTSMILIISSTVVVLLVTCVTVSIFQCCCRKKRNNEELQPSTEETKEEIDNTALLRTRNSVHDTPTYRPLSINSTGDGLVEEAPQLSVRDKIKAFEGQSKPDQENKTSTPEHGKPVRKRPKSKAFEDFENQGIIIGMGMPGRPKSSLDPELDTSAEPGLLNEIMASMSSDYNNISILSDTSENILQNGSHTTPTTEMSSSYIDEDLDEFSGIERNTHILRSFKRAPPPKNRSRSKRSSRRRLPLRDATNLSNDSTDAPNGIADTEKPITLNLEEQTPTDTSVQRVWKDFGSPSIHSSESRNDIDKIDPIETSTNGNRSVINGHTPLITNGHSQKEEGPKRRTDKEATPPDKSSANGNHGTSKPPEGMKMYENPCYESLDVVQASIHVNRVSAVEKSSNRSRTSPDKTEPTRIPRATDRRTTPPRAQMNSSPSRDEERVPRTKSQTRISPESRTSPDSREPRISPPKTASRISPSRSDKRQSWKESPSNSTEPVKPLKQTHL